MGTEQKKPKWIVPFFTIWIGQTFSLLGSMLASFAIIWWMTDTTESARVLATASLFYTLPRIFVAPVAGVLIDRWERRNVLIFADGIIAIFAAWMALLDWTGSLEIWHIYIFTFARSTSSAFHWPAMQASTSLMVPHNQLSRLAGINQTLRGALNIISPLLGAISLNFLPLYGIMSIDVITALLAILPLFFISIPQPTRNKLALAAKQPSIFQDMREGFLYLWKWRGMFILMIIATLVNLTINPATALVPLLVKKHFSGDALQLGWANSALGVGIVLGGLTLSIWGGFRKQVFTILLGLLGMGISTLLIGLAPATFFGGALIGMFLLGFTRPISGGPFFAIMQRKVDPEIQGRVFTVAGSLANAASPVGMIFAGPISDQFGIRSWFIISGLTCILMAAIALLTPIIVNLEDQPRPPLH